MDPNTTLLKVDHHSRDRYRFPNDQSPLNLSTLHVSSIYSLTSDNQQIQRYNIIYIYQYHNYTFRCECRCFFFFNRIRRVADCVLTITVHLLLALIQNSEQFFMCIFFLTTAVFQRDTKCLKWRDNDFESIFQRNTRRNDDYIKITIRLLCALNITIIFNSSNPSIVV